MFWGDHSRQAAGLAKIKVAFSKDRWSHSSSESSGVSKNFARFSSLNHV